ncbi:MAG: caspase family protein, partial [Mariprofundales bacterium]
MLVLQVMPAMAAERLALVIGNSTYKNISELYTSGNDARSIAQLLATPEAGFKVTVHYDLLNKDAMQTAVLDFISTIQGGDEVVFYYSGHAVEVESTNYLLPVGFAQLNIESSTANKLIRNKSLHLDQVLEDLESRKPKVTLIIMDACRDNPLLGYGRKHGLATTSPLSGQGILFAAGSGKRAIDQLYQGEKNPNGLLMRIMKTQLLQRGIEIKPLMSSIIQMVDQYAKQANVEQTPMWSQSLMPDFYIVPALPEDDINKVELSYWDTVKDSKNINMLQAYIKKYPRGNFVNLAQIMIADLEGDIPEPERVLRAGEE